MLQVIVEDGTGLAAADSYVSVADASDYCSDRGLSFSSSPDVDREAALIRASASIDARYRAGFPGYRLTGRTQGLEWPRQAAYDAQGWLIDDASVPDEIVRVTCEAAVRELASPGSMMPDLERGGAIQSLRAGSVSITYASNAAAQTTFTVIDGMLSGILNSAAASGMFGSAVRG